jgi:hypothetical protein
MTEATLKRAQEIQNRILDLQTAYCWLENVEHTRVSLIATGCTVNDTVELSPEARTFMKVMCTGEIDKLRSEFEKL